MRWRISSAMLGAMSFSCPHFRPDDEHCLRLNTDCVPGRRGCVISSDTVFAVPAELRVKLKEEEKRRLALERLLENREGSKTK